LAFLPPTGCVFEPALLSYQVTLLISSLPAYRNPPPVAMAAFLAPPLAAYSHSASVGRRYFLPGYLVLSFFRKSWMSFQLTLSTGQSSQPLNSNSGGSLPITSRQSAWVTSYLPMEKVLTVTVCWHSSIARSFSLSGLPIRKVPPVTETTSWMPDLRNEEPPPAPPFEGVRASGSGAEDVIAGVVVGVGFVIGSLEVSPSLGFACSVLMRAAAAASRRRRCFLLRLNVLMR